MLLFAGVALALSYTASDLLRAQVQGLPDATRRVIAAATVADAEEKACLRAAGLGADLLALVPGAAPAASVGASRCKSLGLDATDMGAADAAAREKAAAELLARTAAREAAARAHPECHGFGRNGVGFETMLDEMESWMEGQISAGRTNFLNVPTLETVTFQGSGGGSMRPILCAWAD